MIKYLTPFQSKRRTARPLVSDNKQSLVRNDTIVPAKTVLWITNSVSYSSRGTSHEKDNTLENLQKQVMELQQAFIESQDDNKKLRSRLVRDDYSKVESSSIPLAHL